MAASLDALASLLGYLGADARKYTQEEEDEEQLTSSSSSGAVVLIEDTSSSPAWGVVMKLVRDAATSPAFARVVVVCAERPKQEVCASFVRAGAVPPRDDHDDNDDSRVSFVDACALMASDAWAEGGLGVAQYSCVIRQQRRSERNEFTKQLEGMLGKTLRRSTGDKPTLVVVDSVNVRRCHVTLRPCTHTHMCEEIIMITNFKGSRCRARGMSVRYRGADARMHTLSCRPRCLHTYVRAIRHILTAVRMAFADAVVGRGLRGRLP